MESFERLKKRSCMRNFDHCGRRLDYFACKGFKVQSKLLKNFLSPIKINLNFSGQEFSIHSFITVIHFSRGIKLYKPFYKIISRNYELCKFWSIDQLLFWVVLRYFPSPETESSCHVSRCELTIRSLPADVPWVLFITHSFLWGRNECMMNEPRRTSAGRLTIHGYFRPCSHVTKMQGFV